MSKGYSKKGKISKEEVREQIESLEPPHSWNRYVKWIERRVTLLEKQVKSLKEEIEELKNTPPS